MNAAPETLFKIVHCNYATGCSIFIEVAAEYMGLPLLLHLSNADLIL